MINKRFMFSVLKELQQDKCDVLKVTLTLTISAISALVKTFSRFRISVFLSLTSNIPKACQLK